ncbi:hypothetical protein DXG03_002699 [Asterophora parasitica]|uniref:Dihydroorotate dehydrogenase catalytic domain-containing protein n=1 Tax=Asterophora parasitica TaxID=117018 RepID=A0A9P7G887_9AGAR|nr:hypothetical protein DXG03_002699 [Asterophora parasitica]
MVKINTLHISPSLVNASCAWASELEQLTALYDSPFTGAVTTRTATLEGFQEDASHTVIPVAFAFITRAHACHHRKVAFTKSTVSTINSYGYSPHPLSQYISWARELLRRPSPAGQPKKPFILSITSSDPAKLRVMVQTIQRLRTELGDADAPSSSIAIELNTSCPNIPNSPPTGYAFPSLVPLLSILKEEHAKDPSLTIGLKLPPFVYRDQFVAVIDGIKNLCLAPDASATCPFAFFTCTNTLGNSLLFDEQSTRPAPSSEATLDTSPSPFAVPTGLGGVAGDALHALALGNVYTFAQLLRDPSNAFLRDTVIIGVGGVTSKAACDRMRRAGAAVVGCATLLGKEGVTAFEIIADGQRE